MSWAMIAKSRLSRRPPRSAPLHVLMVVGLAVLVLPNASPAGETRLFRLQSRAAFLKGTLDGIGIDSLGTLQLADQVVRLAEIGEPFLLTAAAHPDGWVVGTGNAGKVVLVGRDGRMRELFAAEQPEVFAVWADPDGTVFAGSSPDGKVYRFAAGEASVFFEPGETYIWGLARGAEGSLLVATGTEGRLYRVGADGRGEVIFDSEDTHLRSIKVLEGGDVLLGTAGEGLVIKLRRDGAAQTIYDAPHPEVVSFAADPEGFCYAAVLASEASLMDLGQRPKERDAGQGEAASGEANDAEQEPSVEVTLGLSDEAQAGTVGTRPAGFAGPRSEILRISPTGVVETLATFREETVYTLLWHRERLWVGTGLEGKVFSLQNHRPVLEKDVDERQVVALLVDTPGPAFATTNAAALYRIADRTERRGLYTSPALDAGQIARFGTLRWQGRLPSGTQLRFSFRSGMSAEPDRTWTAWAPPRSGPEIPLASLPAGRYVQWRAEFEAANGQSPRLSGVTLSYRQANLPPRIKSLEVLEPGQILVPANFNPAQQVYEPAHPNREGIFTTIEPTEAPRTGRMKTLWKRGYRTLRWEAEDPNEDQLVYELSFRGEGDGREWLTVATDIESDHYSFDATSLPDARYRFRLRAVDRRQSDDPEVQSAEEISEPVLIDHSPPKLESVAQRDGELRVEVADDWNPLREAVFSIDAEEWRPARASDGLLDGQRETLMVGAPEAGRLLLLRVTDAAFNVVTFDLSRSAGK